eukprot:jgi/Mesvir1/13465/Mv16525-RA.1
MTARSSSSSAAGATYVEPVLMYLHVHVISARNLLAKDQDGTSDPYAELTVGDQKATTKIIYKSLNPRWEQKFLFLVDDTFSAVLDIELFDHDQVMNNDFLGSISIPVQHVGVRRKDSDTSHGKQWYKLGKGGKGKESARGDIFLDVYFDERDYPAPSLRDRVGTLFLHVIGATGLMPDEAQQQRKTGFATTDAYAVVKYERTWAKTNTKHGSFNPQWKERFTFPVIDPSSVVIVGVFNNTHARVGTSKDDFFGKVKVRLSTLDDGRNYITTFPLLHSTKEGTIQRSGSLELLLRFEYASRLKVIARYLSPPLSWNYYEGTLFPSEEAELQCQQTHQRIVSQVLAAEKSPIRKEVFNTMMDAGALEFKMSRARTNWERFKAVIRSAEWLASSFDHLSTWQNPPHTVLVSALYVFLVFNAHLLLPAVFLIIFATGCLRYSKRPAEPPKPMEKLTFPIPEEFDYDEDTDSGGVNPVKQIRAKLDAIKNIAAMIQNKLGAVATHGERLTSLLAWTDRRASTIFLGGCLIFSIVTYLVDFRYIAAALGLFLLRHPRFRDPLPPPPANFIMRLPHLADLIVH